jgi:hypothetical protein
MANYVEKYQRHSPDVPLFTLAHAIPPRQLKQKTWQHTSDGIFW